jgi:hypothetical protein
MLAIVAVAQSARGRLAGVITDASGAVLPDVAVTLTGPERRSTITDTQGLFTFASLRAGKTSCARSSPGSAWRPARSPSRASGRRV